MWRPLVFGVFLAATGAPAVGATATEINLNAFDLHGTEVVADAALVTYLRRYGITLTASDPIRIADDRSLYGPLNPPYHDPPYHTGPDRQGAVVASGGHNVIVQNGSGPVQFTLWFDHPKGVVRFERVHLIAASQSGVTHPAWRAVAYDARERVAASVAEDEIRCFGDIPAQHFEIRAPQIRRVTFFADNFRFDGFANLVLDGLVVSDPVSASQPAGGRPAMPIRNSENCPSWPYGPTRPPPGLQ
jgi:hypothetical protein